MCSEGQYTCIRRRIMNINVHLCVTTRWIFLKSALGAAGHFLIVIYFEREREREKIDSTEKKATI